METLGQQILSLVEAAPQQALTIQEILQKLDASEEEILEAIKTVPTLGKVGANIQTQWDPGEWAAFDVP